jgi:hypothetical protein
MLNQILIMARITKQTLLIQTIFLFLAVIISGCASVYQPPSRLEADEESKPVSLQEAPGNEQPVSAGRENASAIEANESRKIHYNGNAELLVTNARATIKKIVDLVNTRNGYVERITEHTVAVQVPADSFEAAFKEILTFGKVLQKVITSVDITEQYRSTELRLKIAKATRDRLTALLAKATSEDDKLQLLKQLEQITATIQSLESQFELLKTKVNYSKITVNLKTYDHFDSRYHDYEPSGFDWINNLGPTNDSIARAGAKLTFKEPDGMLHIKNNNRYWLAESGDKALFRTARRDNEPRGGMDFWLTAIKLRLAPKYRSVESVKVGDYELLRLESYDDKPTIYYVGLKVDKDSLKLVELYFPSVKIEEKYKNNVFNSIRSGET